MVSTKPMEKQTEKQVCGSCLQPKANLQCEACGDAVCKKCAHFNDQERFAYLPSVPKELTYGSYCHSCYHQHLEPAEAEYDLNLEKAKQTLIFYKTENKETHFVRRLEDPVQVKDCPDRAEALIRLAFMASVKGFNAVLDVDIYPTKVRDGAYQTKTWSAAGIPAQITSKKLLG